MSTRAYLVLESYQNFAPSASANFANAHVQEIISIALAKGAVNAAEVQSERLQRLCRALTTHRSISYYAQISPDEAAEFAIRAQVALDSLRKPVQAKIARKPKSADAVAKAAARAAAKKKIRVDSQVRLFADSWPPAFDYIAERFPHRPLVTNTLKLGTTIRPIEQLRAHSPS